MDFLFSLNLIIQANLQSVSNWGYMKKLLFCSHCNRFINVSDEELSNEQAAHRKSSNGKFCICGMPSIQTQILKRVIQKPSTEKPMDNLTY